LWIPATRKARSMTNFEMMARPRTFRLDHRRRYSSVSKGATPIPDVFIRLRRGDYVTASPVPFIVDSGCSVTIMSWRFAAELGISLEGVPTTTGRGAGNIAFRRYHREWTVEADLCGTWTGIHVQFFTPENDSGALLGRRDAFDALELMFIQAQRVMYARKV
jgi:Aspartyl protease